MLALGFLKYRGSSCRCGPLLWKWLLNISTFDLIPVYKLRVLAGNCFMMPLYYKHKSCHNIFMLFSHVTRFHYLYHRRGPTDSKPFATLRTSWEIHAAVWPLLSPLPPSVSPGDPSLLDSALSASDAAINSAWEYIFTRLVPSAACNRYFRVETLSCVCLTMVYRGAVCRGINVRALRHSVQI